MHIQGRHPRQIFLPKGIPDLHALLFSLERRLYLIFFMSGVAMFTCYIFVSPFSFY